MTKAERISYERHLDSIRNEKEAFWTAETDAYVAGEEKGRAEGRAEGEKSKAIEIARNLKKAGIDINIIAENIGLTIDEINAL